MPSLSNYSKEDLAALTPEELSALEAESGDEDGAATGTDKTDETLQTAKTAKTDETTSEATGQTPIYTADAGDADAQIEAQKKIIADARAEEKAALKQLNDGEIDFEQYSTIRDAADAKLDAANAAILDANSLKTRAAVAAEMTAQQQQSAWRGMVNSYMAEAKAAGLDYSGEAGKPLMAELNSLVKVFAQEAVERGMDDAKNLEASTWALDQARQIMAVRHGKPGAASAPAASAPPAQAPANAPRHNLKTLGSMPAAAPNVSADDNMNKLATLQGEDLELFMASLPKSEVDRLFANA